MHLSALQDVLDEALNEYANGEVVDAASIVERVQSESIQGAVKSFLAARSKVELLQTTYAESTKTHMCARPLPLTAPMGVHPRVCI